MTNFHCVGSEFVGFDHRSDLTDPEYAHVVRVFLEHAATVVAPDPAGASEAFRQLTGGTWPDSIDGRAVVAHCEVCAGPIFEDQDYRMDGEGVYQCWECSGLEERP